MTKMAETRTPVRPSNSLPVSQAGAASKSAAAVAVAAAVSPTCLARIRVTSCKLPMMFYVRVPVVDKG